MKYIGSSIASWAIDNIIFNVLEFVLIGLTVSLRIFISTAAARVLSSVFNFSLNRNAVFKSQSGLKQNGGKILHFMVLSACLFLCFGVYCYKVLALSIVLSGIAKIIIDLALFFVSYQIQKRWVFK